MSIFRLTSNVPEVYCDESRDFQLMCRLYDCVVNGVKFDIDSMQYITDTRRCKAEMLPLLQTKLGFFSTSKYDSDSLRYILRGFPDIIKNKGSLLAIKQSINLFFRIKGIRSDVSVWYLSEPGIVNGKQMKDHTIVIGLDSSVTDTSLLEELLQYIIPTGFEYYLYFYKNYKYNTKLSVDTKATLLFVNDSINSQLRSSIDTYTIGSIEDRLVGAVDTIETISTDADYDATEIETKELGNE